MPRGGHGRSGPAAFNEAARALHGTGERRRHREKGDAGEPMIDCAAPPGLTKAEAKFWAYYAPQLHAERRLTMKARDVLAKYCTGLAVITGLRAQLASRRREDIAVRHETRRELRQWLSVTRLYENDLLLNPASAVRAPALPTLPGADPFDEFDEPGGVQ